MLDRYAARRDRLWPRSSPAFFVTRTGHRATQRWADEAFARLLALAGISTPHGRRAAEAGIGIPEKERAGDRTGCHPSQ